MIIGIIAAVVALNVGGFFGTGTLQAANTEADSVLTAVFAYMADNGLSEFVGDSTQLGDYLVGEPKTIYDIDTKTTCGITPRDESVWPKLEWHDGTEDPPCQW